MEDGVVVHKASDHNVTKAYFIFKVLRPKKPCVFPISSRKKLR